MCSVEKTSTPESAARTASWAVSGSRISPIMITSGSWRSSERMAVANVNPARGRTWVCRMAGNSYSTGSSTVMMFRERPLSTLSAE